MYSIAVRDWSARVEYISCVFPAYVKLIKEDSWVNKGFPDAYRIIMASSQLHRSTVETSPHLQDSGIGRSQFASGHVGC